MVSTAAGPSFCKARNASVRRRVSRVMNGGRTFRAAASDRGGSAAGAAAGQTNRPARTSRERRQDNMIYFLDREKGKERRNGRGPAGPGRCPKHRRDGSSSFTPLHVGCAAGV